MARRSLTGYETAIGASARLHSAANQSLPSAALTFLNLGATTHNIGGVFDLSVANRIKTLRSGSHLITSAIFFEFGNNGQRNGYVRKNGVTPPVFEFGTVAAAAARPAAGDVVRLVAGDYIELAAYIDGGAASQATAGPGNTFLTLTYLGT